MGEPATTQLATALLRNPTLAELFVAWIRMSHDVDLPAEKLTFVAEALNSAGKRPDIVGFDDKRRPRLIIELKFNAEVDLHQIAGYRREQINHCGIDRHEALTILVVPERRRMEADDMLQQIGLLLPDAINERDVLAGTGTGTWEEWLSEWDRVPEDPSLGEPAIVSDVAQFKALCKTLLKTVIPPLGHAANSSRWRERERDVMRLPDVVVARLDFNLWDEGYKRHRGAELKIPFRRRRSLYVSLGGRGGTLADLGIRTDLADAGQTPLWLRVRDDGWNDLATVRSRVGSSSYGARARNDGGHVWIPIDVPPHLGDDLLIDAIVDEAMAVAEVIDGKGRLARRP
jgi:hypothetical protein